MNVNRFHDNSTGLDIIQVLPGTLYVTDIDECITTILGSCIAVCLRDPVTNIGGLNHFMLPSSLSDGTADKESANYGQQAMQKLIENMQASGASTNKCEAKIFGGGSMFPNEQQIGMRNIAFASEYLENRGIAITSQDVGQFYCRRIRFYTGSGKVMVKRLRSLHNKHVNRQELDYEHYLSLIRKQ